MLGLDGEQREQAEAGEQVQRDDRRIEAQRHRERAERSLHADPDQRPDGPARADASAALTRDAQRERRQDDDEHADRRRGVAVQHLDPCLGDGHRAGRQRGLGGGDVLAGADRARVSVAAGPIRAAEAGIAQTREGAEQDEIEAEKEDEPGERLQAQRRRVSAAAAPDPGERDERDQRADGEHAEQRREVVGRHGSVHGHGASARLHRGARHAERPPAHRPGRSHPAEAPSSLSRSRFSRAGSGATGTRIIHSPRGSTR